MARKRFNEAEIAVLTQTFLKYGKPEYIHSNNGSEFTSLEIKMFLQNTGVTPLYIAPGSPWG